MKTSFLMRICCVGVLLSIAPIASANPILPDDLPFLAEIQVTDSLHWNVEVCLNPYQGYPINYPCSTDTFLLFCWPSNSLPPNDSMRRPVIHEVFDTSGLAVLTPQHFPGLKLVKGSYLTLQIRPGSAIYNWSTQIPTYLTPQQSMVGALSQYCCGYGPTGCIDICDELSYTLSFCPTIGIVNSRSLGSITGQVRGADSQLLANIHVNLNTNPALGSTYSTTNGSGQFSFSSLDHCHTYYLRFTDTTGALISDTTIGPLSIIMGGTITIEVLLNYSSTSVVPLKESPVKTGTVHLLSPKIRGQIPLAFSGTFTGQGTVDIFSANGSLVRSLSFECRGPGTYTVLWDGRNGQSRLVPAGTYVCRITLDKEIRCKGFVAW